MDEQLKQKLDELKADFLSITYHGPFDSRILTVFAREIENHYFADEEPAVAKKIFKIFIELAQNIAMYSVERCPSDDKNFAGYGVFMLKEDEDFFWLITGNKAKKDDAFLAAEKCNTINNLSREELREYKRTLRKQPANDKGGGNIGLIQVALLSNNKLDYDVYNVDNEYSFFTIGVKIPKKLN